RLPRRGPWAGSRHGRPRAGGSRGSLPLLRRGRRRASSWAASETIFTLYRLSRARVGRPRRGERTLSREQVVGRALELADAEGVDAVTMRRLGRELGVEAMALYTHVRSKADLLSAMGSHVLSELDVEPRELPDWRGRIETVCRAWAVLRERHPSS